MGLLTRYRHRLHDESFAGGVLLLAAFLALIWANSPARASYERLSTLVVGPESAHLALTISQWASDGLLVIFFFTVGLELKQEFSVGSLRDPRKAAVPILAALCGILGPIGVYMLIQLLLGSGEYGGWAVPVATDIAFALAVLAIFGKGLPPAARTFLMTLAVADDLGGILVIGVFFSEGVSWVWLIGATAAIASFGALVQRRKLWWWALWPLGVLAWYAMHNAGIHATIAGVLLGMTVPARVKNGKHINLTAHLSERFHFLSTGIVLPIFAFFASGVNVVDSGGVAAMLADPVAIGIYVGLPLGKCVGIFGGVWVMTRLCRLRLGNGIDLADIFPISLVAGVGFTVSLLIAYLSFDAADPHEPHARIAVILGSVLAALLGGLALRLRLRHRVRGAGAHRHGHGVSRSDDAGPRTRRPRGGSRKVHDADSDGSH